MLYNSHLCLVLEYFFTTPPLYPLAVTSLESWKQPAIKFPAWPPPQGICPCCQGQGVLAYLTPPHPRPGRVPSIVGGERCPGSVSGGLPPPARRMTGAREEIPSPALGFPLPKGLLGLRGPAGPEPALLLGTDHLLWPVQVPVMLKSQLISQLKQAQPVTLGTARWRKTSVSLRRGPEVGVVVDRSHSQHRDAEPG